MLARLRESAALSSKERDIHDRGLVSVLRSFHDDLDRAVLSAYGWEDMVPLLEVANGLADAGAEGTPPGRAECRRLVDDTVLERFVALNAARAPEEASGRVRWLRPDFQNISAGSRPAQQTLDATVDDEVASAIAERRRWPTGLAEQIKAVSAVLAASGKLHSLDDVASAFTGLGRWRDHLLTILETLEALGRARHYPNDRWSDAFGVAR